MMKMCENKAEKRASIQECLNHPWFKKNGELLQNPLMIKTF
jgi:hypothetical protein